LSSWTSILPELHGLDIVKQATSHCPKTPILVFSLYAEEQDADRALRAGAAAYISKDRPPSALVESVKAALRGAVKRPLVRHPMLSEREMQVLRLLARGTKRRDIARALEINEKTVSTYKTRLLQKLGLRNLVDLVRYGGRARGRLGVPNDCCTVCRGEPLILQSDSDLAPGALWQWCRVMPRGVCGPVKVER
jgi:DNA-binding NarL/FixJ family response regulator